MTDEAPKGDVPMSAQPIEYDAPAAEPDDDLAELLEIIATVPDDNGYRHEILNGELVVNPPATWQHENRTRRIYMAILRSLPDGWAAYTNVGFTADGDHVVPDVTVTDQELPDLEQQWGDAPVRLVVEVESITTKHRDRKLKTEIYARQGIDAYWRIEKSGATHVYTNPRPDGTWDEIRTVRPGETLKVGVPFEVELSPAHWL